MSRIMMSGLFCLWGILASPVWSGTNRSAADISVERVSLKRGTVIGINHIMQDRNGFLWLSTDDGLWRYDGIEPYYFVNNPHDPRSLSDDRVNVAFEDKSGLLWVGTSRGLNLLDTQQKGFRRFELREPEKMPVGILSLGEDDHGGLWAGTATGLYRIGPDADEVVFFDPKAMGLEKGEEEYVLQILSDGAGGIWARTMKGLLHYSGLTHQFQWHRIEGPEGTFQAWMAIAPSRGEHLWALVGNRLHRMNRADGSLSPEPFPEDPAMDRLRIQWENVLEDDRGWLWFATAANGIFYFRPETGKWQSLTHNPNNDKSLSFNQVDYLFEDRGGLLWAATTAGLNKIRPKNKPFVHVYHQPERSDSLSSNVVFDVLKDSKGNLWVCSDKGLNLQPAGKQGFRKFFHDPQYAGSLPADEVYAVVEDLAGRIWVATKVGLGLYDPWTDSFRNYPIPDREAATTENFFRLAADGLGFLWMSDLNEATGLWRFEPATGEYRAYRFDRNDPRSIASNRSFSLFVDHVGMIWVGTERGLCLYHKEKDSFKRITFENPENPEQPRFDFVYSFYEDPQGNLWMATAEGLKQFDRKSGRFSSFFEDDGLKSRDIRGLTGDENGILWLSQSNGLIKYNPATRTAIQYDMLDGLNNKFLWGSVYSAPDGAVYLGGTYGFNYFYPKALEANHHVPQVLLTNFYSKNHKSIPEQPIWALDQLELGYKDRYIKIYFAAMDFTQPEKNLYSYRLKGSNDEWSPPSPLPFASFPDLEAGEYVFELKGANNDGLWNREPARLKIRVVPPFWKTTPAFLLYALLFPSLFYAGHRMRVRQLFAREQMLSGLVEERTKLLKEEKEKTEAQARQLVELDRLKTQFFSNVSHEFRTPLTLILGPLETMIAGTLEGDKDKLKRQHEMMLRNGRRLLRLINQLLDISKLEAGKMRLHAHSARLVPFVKPIVFAFHSLAEKNAIQLTFHCTDEELELYFDAEKLEKILFNLLSNAFQFTENGGAIGVSLDPIKDDQGRNAVAIRVSDTGVGIHERELPYIFDRFRQADGSSTRAHEGTGIGLSLVRELVHLHQGQVHVKSRPGEGTVLRVDLPLGSAHLKPSEISQQGHEESHFVSQSRAQVEMAGLNHLSHVQGCDTKGLGETILVVDDHPDVRGFIRDAFQPQYRVLEAADGREGLAMAHKSRPDLIISDVMMPVMDGYQMCRTLKKNHRFAHIPIILLTAKASDDMKLEGLEIGVDDYLSKPFNIRELQVRVRNLLHMRGQERSLKKSLEMAHKAQVSMLPLELPKAVGLDIATFCKPATEVGGDYYDFISYENGSLGVVIGDVSGKGMPAALYMTMTKGLVQAYAGKGRSPRETLTKINHQFRRASASNIFISLMYAIIDPASLKMVFASAGHNPMILRSNGLTRFIKSRGMAIGLEDGKMFERVVRDQEIQLQPGDTIVFYTDGITEGINVNREAFGEKRLLDLVDHGSSLNSEALMASIKQECRQFVGNMDQFDDMTAVVIKIPEGARILTAPDTGTGGRMNPS